MMETLIVVGAVLAMGGLAVATFRWGRSTRDGSSVDVSSANIAVRDGGWIAGLVKLQRGRRKLKSEVSMRRAIADAKKADSQGSVGSLDKLLEESDGLPD